MVDDKSGQDQLDLEALKKKLNDNLTKVTAKEIELLPDDDVADLSPVGVDTSDMVTCMTCDIVGPYKQEEKNLKAKKGKRIEITFQIMRMTECGHGLVYGVRTASVEDAAADAKKFQNRFFTLAKAKDQSGAQRSYRKFEKALARVIARQRAAWRTNQHRIDLDAIPDLVDAA